MAEFLYLYRQNPASRQAVMGTPEQQQKNMQQWMAWFRDLEKKGALKSAGQPLEPGGKVVRQSITDGPFVEAKDVIGGYSIVEAKDLAHASDLAKGCPAIANSGSVEVRPIMKMDM